MGILNDFRRRAQTGGPTASEFIDSISTSDAVIDTGADGEAFMQLPGMKDSVSIVLKEFGEGIVEVDTIQARTPGQGDGTKLMKWLIELAKEYGIKLHITPNSFGDASRQEDVENWYKSLGFRWSKPEDWGEGPELDMINW